MISDKADLRFAITFEQEEHGLYSQHPILCLIDCIALTSKIIFDKLIKLSREGGNPKNSTNFTQDVQ